MNGPVPIKKNTAKQNMSSTVCASSMYNRLCMKMSSFMFVRVWTMSCILHLSCGKAVGGGRFQRKVQDTGRKSLTYTHKLTHRGS